SREQGLRTRCGSSTPPLRRAAALKKAGAEWGRSGAKPPLPTRGKPTRRGQSVISCKSATPLPLQNSPQIYTDIRIVKSRGEPGVGLGDYSERRFANATSPVANHCS